LSAMTAVEPNLGTKWRRKKCFEALQKYLTAAELAAATTCATRLRAMFPADKPSSENVVLVAYGGGKDSSYTVTFVRLMQLILDEIDHETFAIRIVTNWNLGMPPAVFENIDRAYLSLGLYDDPSCELLLVNGARIMPFQRDVARDSAMAERVRLDTLMTGHRTAADARPTFCNSCNLSMLSAFGRAASYRGGVDFIITGDSADEQRSYVRWVSHVARRIGATTKPSGTGGFTGFLDTANQISQIYFGDIYGAGASADVSQRAVVNDLPHPVHFFSIYGDTAYASGKHWELLTEFLGFEFDDIAFSFTESDCGNPALMAHIRGLKCEYIFRRSYAEGISEYAEFALSLMREKHFPEFLIEKMRERYATPDAIAQMRQKMVQYCSETFNINEDQLLCMVYAPFGDKASNLERYLTEIQPHLLGRQAEIVELLADADRDADASTKPLAATLEQCSGLGLRYLRRLYASPVRSAERPGPDPRTDVIGAILEGDPHKATIKTQHSPCGAVVEELISGR
jgi:hypothetical protein